MGGTLALGSQLSINYQKLGVILALPNPLSLEINCESKGGRAKVGEQRWGAGKERISPVDKVFVVDSECNFFYYRIISYALSVARWH